MKRPFKQEVTRLALAGLVLTLPLVASGQQGPTRKSDYVGASILSTALNPDGRTMAVAFGSGDRIELWDVLGGTRSAKLENVSGVKHERTSSGLTQKGGGALAVCFSPDGKTLVAGIDSFYLSLYVDRFNPEQVFPSWISDRGGISLWNVATRTRTHVLWGHARRVVAVAFSPDGRTIASGSEDRSIKLWDAATGRDLFTLREHTEAITALAFSPNSSVLASASADGTIRLWDRSRGVNRATLRGHAIMRDGVASPVAVAAVAFSPDGATLASGGRDGCVRLWDVATGKNTMTLRGEADDTVHFVAFSPDGHLLASGGRKRSGSSAVYQLNNINLWHMPGGAPALSLTGLEAAIRNGTVTPNGRSFVAIAQSNARIFMWDLPTALIRAEGRPAK